jgi:hypothetical protein
MIFTKEFIEELITNAEQMDVEILNSEVSLEQLKLDLKNYSEFKEKFMSLLGKLEKEIFEKQTNQVVRDLIASG